MTGRVKNLKLIHVRESFGYSQETIASSVGINRAAYSHIECGRKNPSIAVALRIADTLHSTVEELFGSPADNIDTTAGQPA